MDEKDEKIIKQLLKNSRTPLSAISADLGISETAVRKRLKKLEMKGIIRAYTAIVDPYYLGYESVALVGVDAEPEMMVSIFEKIKVKPEVRYSAMTSGDHMMMFEVWCKDSAEMKKFLNKIERMDGTKRICPAVMIRRAE
jgi:Lrp/AsnC family transcriptional regulator for asnA, asnC and gidA